MIPTEPIGSIPSPPALIDAFARLARARVEGGAPAPAIIGRTR